MLVAPQEAGGGSVQFAEEEGGGDAGVVAGGVVLSALGVHVPVELLVAVGDGRDEQGGPLLRGGTHQAVGGLDGGGALDPVLPHAGVVGRRVGLLVGLVVDDVDGRHGDVAGVAEDLHGRGGPVWRGLEPLDGRLAQGLIGQEPVDPLVHIVVREGRRGQAAGRGGVELVGVVGEEAAAQHHTAVLGGLPRLDAGGGLRRADADDQVRVVKA